MEIKKVLEEGNIILKNNRIKNHLLDSEILMSKVLNNKREFVLLNLDKKMSLKKIDYFKNLIEERSKGKPISYIIGTKDFWKYKFSVKSGVLIPRPDTELIIDQVIKLTKYKSKLKILDIGIGSGCILLSILKERKDFYGVGIDISKKCTDLSKFNTLKHGLTNRVKIIKSNIDNFEYGKYDLIISNPPYISSLDLKYLEKDIIKFEPRSALDGGLDGLSEIRKVVKKSSELIKKNGILVLEIAFNQKRRVEKILKEKGFYINIVLKDFANHDRCIISKKI